MKKILLTFAFVLAGIYTGWAQLSLSHDGNVLGDTVTYWIDPAETSFVDFKMSIHNGSDNGANVQVARKIITPLAENQFTFCLGAVCYGPGVDSCDTDYLFVPAGGASLDEEFKASYATMSIIGTAVVRYNVYNKDNPADSVSIVIRYWVSPTSVEEDILKDGFLSEIYPNPAVNNVAINYQLTPKVYSAKVSISNLLGSVVKESDLTLNGNQFNMSISELENGIYFYSVFINGEIYTTKKLIIRK